ISGAGHIEANGVEPGHTQELLNDAVHARDIGSQLCKFTVSLHRLKRCGDNGEWRAQLMGGVRSKFALHGEALLEPVKGTVDGGNERREFAGKIMLRQTNGGRAWADCSGHFGDVSDRFKSTANDI